MKRKLVILIITLAMLVGTVIIAPSFAYGLGNSLSIERVLTNQQIKPILSGIYFRMHLLETLDEIEEIKQTAISTMQNKDINLYIIYSALLFSTTSLFCWCFQPLLKISSAPVFMFSFVYVINHALRAGFSYNVNGLKKFFGFNRLLVITTFLCLYSFACMILSFYFKLPNISMLSLIFVCIGIGFQLSFAIANINHIHSFAKEEVRATISSVNNMLQQTISGLSLIAFKFVIAPHSNIEGLTFTQAFSLFGFIYMCLFGFLLYKIYERNKLSPI